MTSTRDPRFESVPPAPPLTEGDRELLEGFLHGDRRATEQVRDWILAVVRHRAWRLDRTDDLAQDAAAELIRAFRAGRFEGRSSLKTFVQTVTKYTCLDAVRRARRVSFLPLEETGEPEPPGDDDPGRDLDARETARLCYAVLRRLPEPCRRLLVRVAAEDPAYEDLAAELEVAVGTIKSRVARCRDRANTIRRRLLCEPRTWRGESHR
ncbi:MAG: RNA polymerase sigma factor [bacterium]